MSAPIHAVLFDLDDTLFLQEYWLAGAWRTVADAGAREGLDRASLHAALCTVAAQGSARGGIIDKSVAAIGGAPASVEPLVAAFRAHRAVDLQPIDGVGAALVRLRERTRIGLVTDGDVAIQRGKLVSLGLTDAFDVVVFSDDLGREHRKPHPAPFVAALESLGVEPGAAVFVGDRPDKDVAGALAVGMRALRVRTGEYREQRDLPGTWASVDDACVAIRFVERVLDDADVGVNPRP